MKIYTDLVQHRGNQPLMKALEMSVLSILQRRPLHLHAEGLRGTGKTTIIRAVRTVLPWIQRVRGCLYNCDPRAPHCPEHRVLQPEGLADIGSEWVPMPFWEISHSAKIGTVVGSIDLSRLTDLNNPSAALLPGTIAQAHRGILFVDEINRLADTSPELADVLLDVMGTKPGRLQIEETGVPRVELTTETAVWAASNPDEEPGPLEDIRRQLADRFDLMAVMGRPGDAGKVRSILMQGGLGRAPVADAGVDEDRSAERAREFRRFLALRGARLLRPFPAGLAETLSEMFINYNLESLRAVEALQLAGQMAALRADRVEASLDDLIEISALVLRHRVDLETLAEINNFLNLKRRPEAARAGLNGVSFGHPPSAGTEADGDPARQRDQESPLEDRTRKEAGLSRWLATLKDRLRAEVPGGTGNNGVPGPDSDRPLMAPPPADCPNRAAGWGSAPRDGGSWGRRSRSGAGCNPVPSEIADPDLIEPVAPPNRAVQISCLPAERLLIDGNELGWSGGR